MRKRLCLGSMVLAAAGSAVLVIAVPAHSEPPPQWGDPGPPPHPHLHLNGVVVDENGDPVSIAGCRPLANGEVVPRSAHHENLHVGTAGDAQWQAGNAVVPVLPPHTPWDSCESLMEYFFGPSS